MNTPRPWPLVSCIMPTYNRRAFVPRAVSQFLEQDYAGPTELIVVDDGADSVADLMPADPRVRYIRLEQRQTIGAKRNVCCAAARGEFISHWDDDDWSASWRLAYEVGELIRSGADACGAERMLLHEPQSGRVWSYEPPRWLLKADTYIDMRCYRKTAWLAAPFENRMTGEDMAFFRRIRNLVALGDPRFYTLTIHGGNTCSYTKMLRHLPSLFVERDGAYLAWWQGSRGPTSAESAAAQFEEEERFEGLKRFNAAHGLSDTATQSLEDFRERAGLPAPSAAEVEDYNRKRAAVAGA